jgi:hypothetical protein
VEVLFVLLVSFILLRGAGLLGIRRLSSRRNAGLGALVIMFLFTGFSADEGLYHPHDGSAADLGRGRSAYSRAA